MTLWLFPLAATAGPPSEPAFAWRGCMIDVSRHFFPLSFLQRQIDELSRHGINRLHLHLTDAGGWRMQIDRYPQLTRRAAWRTQSDWDLWWAGNDRHYADEGSPGAYGGYYTHKELRGLVAYAAERGISVVPEVEMPGHSEEVLAAFPALGCDTARNTGDFCPASPEAERFLRHVIDEVLDVFPSDYIHLGGDEANMTAWRDCKRCRRRMEELHTDNLNDLQADFMSRMMRYVNAKGRKAIVWDEVVSGTSAAAPALPAAGNAVMVWRDAAIARQAIAQGLEVIMCPNSHCYLDYYQDAPHTQPRAPGGLITLQRAYSFEPLAGLSADEARHVLGLQGNLWTEYVTTPAHAEYMLWPRMAALARIGRSGAARPSYHKFLRTVRRETRRQQADGMNPFDITSEQGTRPESRRPLRHAARGAVVAYAAPYSPYYTAGGPGALTDGVRGNWQHTDGRWQGFIGRDGIPWALDAVLDLGKPRRVSSVEAVFLHNSNDWIYLPADFRISAAGADSVFTEVATRTEPRTASSGPRYVPFAWQGRLDGIRYLRVQARATAPGEWLFTDEIVVK